MEEKKNKVLTSIAMLFLLVMTIGATYAFFTAQIGDSITKDVSATSNTTDLLTFSVSQNISFTVRQSDFQSGGQNQSGDTTVSATLTPNNKTGAATRHYYMYLDILNNPFVYSDTNPNEDSELMLQVFDSNNQLVTIPILGEQTTTKGVTGYDITRATGLKTLLDYYEISASNHTSTTHTWRVVITLINLDVNQNNNAGKVFEGTVFIQEEPEGPHLSAELESCFSVEENLDGTLTITGYDRDRANCPTDVVIPYKLDLTQTNQTAGNNKDVPVTFLPNNKNEGTVVRLASSNRRVVTAIGDDAFKCVECNDFNDNCEPCDENSKRITSVTMPSSVHTIGSAAFANNAISSLVIGNGVETIDFGAFSNNIISNLVLSNTVTTIGKEAFYGNHLTEVTIPQSLEYLGPLSFGNNEITNIIINGAPIVDVVGYMQNGPFFENNNDNATTITINTDEQIPDNYNYDLFGFGEVELVITDNYQTYNASCEEGVDDCTPLFDAEGTECGIVSVTFGSNVTTIGPGAFAGCPLGTITIPDTVTTIGDYAFYKSGITSVTIGSHVTTIGDYAFAYNGITNLTIPNSVTTIGNHAFEIDINGEDNIKISTLNLGNHVQTIGDYAFAYNDITSLTIPNSVTTIGDYAFDGSGVQSLTLGNHVQTIGESAFNYNDITGTVVIPETTTFIGDNAFYDSPITNLYIKSSTISIGKEAFYGNTYYNLYTENVYFCNYSNNVDIDSSTFYNTANIDYDANCTGI